MTSIAPPVALSIPDLADGDDTLTVALALAACGIYVGPSIRGAKNPGSILGERWQDKTSRDPKQITAWFAGTNHDLFIHCGRSGLVALDVDRPDELPGNWKLDAAPYQPTRPDTPRRGHYIFAMPPGRTIGNPVFSWGEVRGLNGVIMVFPSHHRDGGQYGPWLRTGAVPVLPDVIAEKMPDASAAEDAATDAQVDAFLAAYTAATRPEVLNGLTKVLTPHATDASCGSTVACPRLQMVTVPHPAYRLPFFATHVPENGAAEAHTETHVQVR